MRIIFLSMFLCIACFANAQENSKKETILADTREDEYQVAILGDSALNAVGISGENEKSSLILARLFKLISVLKPDAVFFTGNLTKGLSDDISDEPDGLFTSENSSNSSSKYVYSNDGYKKQLDAFSVILEKNLGKSIPFYPLIGENKLGGVDAVKIFVDHFGIKNIATLTPNQLAYTEHIGNGFFAAIGTDWYDPNKSPTSIGNSEIKMLNWLFDVLHENVKKSNYLFVLGHEPAYSTTRTAGNYLGMDRNPEELNLFWKILKVNGVHAYFSGMERLYDRSNRQGVWQIISGGAGAPLDNVEAIKAFYHFIILSYSKDGKSVPKIKVVDLEGTVRDEFELKGDYSPIYQLRISNSFN